MIKTKKSVIDCAFWLELTQDYRNFWTCEWIFCWNIQCLTIYIGDRYSFRYGHVRFDTNINPQVPVFDKNSEPVPAPNRKAVQVCYNTYLALLQFPLHFRFVHNSQFEQPLNTRSPSPLDARWCYLRWELDLTGEKFLITFLPWLGIKPMALCMWSQHSTMAL